MAIRSFPLRGAQGKLKLSEGGQTLFSNHPTPLSSHVCRRAVLIATGNLMGQGAITVPYEPFTLHGPGFGANRDVTVYLDQVAGQEVGTAHTGSCPDGSFQSQFTMPVPESGGYTTHDLVAVSRSKGQQIQATVSVTVEAPRQ